MKREARQQRQINLSNEQYSNHLPTSTQTKKDEEPRPARIIAFSPNRLRIEKLRAIWNDSEVTYTDSELLRIRDWFYTVAEMTVSTINQREAQALEASNLLESVSQANKTIPFPSRDNHTPINDKASKKSHSLRPGIYRRTG